MKIHRGYASATLIALALVLGGGYYFLLSGSTEKKLEPIKPVAVSTDTDTAARTAKVVEAPTALVEAIDKLRVEQAAQATQLRNEIAAALGPVTPPAKAEEPDPLTANAADLRIRDSKEVPAPPPAPVVRRPSPRPYRVAALPPAPRVLAKECAIWLQTWEQNGSPLKMPMQLKPYHPEPIAVPGGDYYLRIRNCEAFLALGQAEICFGIGPTAERGDLKTPWFTAARAAYANSPGGRVVLNPDKVIKYTHQPGLHPPYGTMQANRAQTPNYSRGNVYPRRPTLTFVQRARRPGNTFRRFGVGVVYGGGPVNQVTLPPRGSTFGVILSR